MKTLLLPVLLLASTTALAAPPAGFDARVEALRAKVGVPGMAVTIVEHGRTVLAKAMASAASARRTRSMPTPSS